MREADARSGQVPFSIQNQKGALAGAFSKETNGSAVLSREGDAVGDSTTPQKIGQLGVVE